jgi:hypothetical protein
MSSTRLRSPPFATNRLRAAAKRSGRPLDTDLSAQHFDPVAAAVEPRLQFGADLFHQFGGGYDNPQLARMGVSLFPLLSPFERTSDSRSGSSGSAASEKTAEAPPPSFATFEHVGPQLLADLRSLHASPAELPAAPVIPNLGWDVRDLGAELGRSSRSPNPYR